MGNGYQVLKYYTLLVSGVLLNWKEITFIECYTSYRYNHKIT